MNVFKLPFSLSSNKGQKVFLIVLSGSTTEKLRSATQLLHLLGC